MAKISFEELCKPLDAYVRPERICSAKRRNIQKDWHCYHVISNAWKKRRLFFGDVALYRHRLLCEMCAKHGLTVLFESCMTNHIHEVFLTPDWDTLSKVIKIVNSQVSRYCHTKYPELYEKQYRVFAFELAYIPVKSVQQLFYLGKYVVSNMDNVPESEREEFSFDCRWLFRRSSFPVGYDPLIYKILFELKSDELVDLYDSMSRQEAYLYSITKFDQWTDFDNYNLLHNKKVLPDSRRK